MGTMVGRSPGIVASLAVLFFLSMPGSVAQHAKSGVALTRIEGVEPMEGVIYVRILRDGKLLSPGADAAEAPPRLIAQCTRSNTGAARLEVRMTFGGVNDMGYHLPWKNTYAAVRPDRTEVTFEFLGYTHVKPMRREWEVERIPSGELLYLTSALYSHNLEETNVYLRYLAALPTLRLSRGSQTAEFECGAWLAAVQDEPLCKAAGA